MPVIWDGFEMSSEYGLRFSRLNPIGVHDPDFFYYVWEAFLE